MLTDIETWKTQHTFVSHLPTDNSRLHHPVSSKSHQKVASPANFNMSKDYVKRIQWHRH